MMVATWRNLEIENEILRRLRNEWIERASDSFGADEPEETYICECGDPNCSESVSLTRAEYEVVRSDGNHFLVAANHENPESELVTFENERFAIVQKLMAAGRKSQETNPRRSGRRLGRATNKPRKSSDPRRGDDG